MKHPSELNTFARWFGGHRIDPKTGVEGPTTLTLTEYLCHGEDVRRYTVEHRANHNGNVIRSKVFTCASYMGTPENRCGSLESTQARALLREWYAEGWL